MNTGPSIILQGVALAVVATLCWAFNFIAPYVLQGYSIHDFMLVRFLIAGTLGLLGLPLFRAQLRGLRMQEWLTGMGLGVLGYFAYSVSIAGGVIFGGPTLIAAFIGTVPVLQALLGNARARTLNWGQLALPIGLLCVGLLLVNLQAGEQAATRDSIGLGVMFSLVAVLLWLSFSVVNQAAMDRLHTDATGAWTCLMMIGAGLAALLLTPIAWHLDLLRLPEPDLPGFGLQTLSALKLYLWALVIALLSSVLGAGAWNLASRRLPMVLSGQLIALESFFATLLGLAFHGRLPTLGEAMGLALILFGTAYSVQIILRPRRANIPCEQRDSP
ncbi:EamA family transporter [Pseudomonas syringae pv. syringae]|uniref:DMT family transporter n=1 Tax=Pseudomonas syringae TaxID=317 RepID=UPI0023F914D4|nr:EamA family transporter [Pseudomonas syringae]MDF5890321.1 EamA family transporter [Pseudomonas syringae pv. syringae]